MTSTIAPKKDTFLLNVSDPYIRLDHYRKALHFYIDLLHAGVFDKIVYVDNSGFPLDELREISIQRECSSDIEFISYESDLDPGNSRYFLEINVIDYAMHQSKSITSAPFATIWKVTGRYIVANAGKIVRGMPPESDLYINTRDIPRKSLDFYFIGYRCCSYPNHIGQEIDEYRGVRNGEEILRERIDAGWFVGVSIAPRFGTTPRIFGVRGHDGAAYGGAVHTAKFIVRSAMNILVPSFKI